MGKKQSDVYEKKACYYPVVLSILPLFILSILVFGSFIDGVFEAERIWTALISIIPSSIISASLLYFIMACSKLVSKIYIQSKLYGDDECYMPTTNFLLWDSCEMTDDKKHEVRKKVFFLFKIKLKSKKFEKENEKYARRHIVEAVRLIRERTRDDKILFSHNCYYGFARNLIGANICCSILTLCLLVMNYNCVFISNSIIIAVLAIYCLLSMIAFGMMKHYARAYAHQMYTSFLS